MTMVEQRRRSGSEWSAEPIDFLYVRKPWLRSSPTGRWCVRYHFRADRPSFTYVYLGDTPQDLVRFLRDMPGLFDVQRVLED